MVDRKDPPHVKLAIRQALAEQEGFEFDERRERRVLGLPMPDNREPVFIPASKTRKMETERLDRQQRQEEEEAIEEGKKRIEEDAAAAKTADQGEELAELREMNKKLQSQIEELLDQKRSGEDTAEEPPPEKPRMAFPPDEDPHEGWGRNQIVEWIRLNGYVPLPKGGIGMSKMAILEHAQRQIAKRDGTEVEAAGGDEN